MNDASAVWSENVTVNGFNACVLVAGRHFFDSLYPPNVNWVAFQKGVIIPDLLNGGIIELPTWETGSQCAFISLNVCLLKYNKCCANKICFSKFTFV